MALNLPNIPRVTTAARATGPGSAVGGAIGGVKIPKTVNPRALFTAPRIAKTPKPKVAAADQFTLPLPYSNIPQTAQNQYAADAALATKNASLGVPTVDQRNAQTAAQSAAVGSLYQQLAQQIAGIQHVSVDQTNAGTGALGTQNAAAGATGNPVASATGVANPGVTGNAGAQAVLAAQGAGQGNYLGALQGSALAGGTAAQQRALQQGQSNIASDQLGQQKTLQSLLAGLATPSSRETTMLNANQTVKASNLQTKLSQWQQLSTDANTYRSLGQKTQADNADRQARLLLAQINQTGETQRTNSTNRTRAQIAADNAAARTAAAKTTAAAKVKAAQTAAAAKTKTTASKTPAGGFKNYKVTVDVPQPAKTGKDPVTGLPTSTPQKDKRVVKTVPANVWNQFVKSGRNFSVLGIPKGSKVRSHTGY